MWFMDSFQFPFVISFSGKAHFFESEYKGSRCVSVNAVMSGGNGDCGWQKAQLFRESTKAREETSSFDLKVSFEAS